jgi:hypothetical protein
VSSANAGLRKAMPMNFTAGTRVVESHEASAGEVALIAL